MKRIYLIILMALTALTGFAQKRQMGDVIYVYQKNGDVKAFLRDEIDEMGYSNYDTLGVVHDEIVSQIISLGEEAYIIPLADIDSISFVTPDAVYKPGVIHLDGELLQYVDRCDSTTIYFAANTPAGLLPKVGDKLGIGYLCEKFPEGFAGVVKSVNGSTVECDYEDLEEIFETLFCVIRSNVGQGENAARRRALEVVTPYEKDFTFDPININFSEELLSVLKVGSYAFKGESVLNATIKPTFHLKAEIAMRPPFGLRLSGTISGKMHAISKSAIYGSLEIAKDLAYSGRAGNFYGFGIDYKVGAFAKIKGDVTADIENRQQAEFSTGFAIGPKDMIHEKPVTTFKMTENKTIIYKACLDGLLGYGAVGEIGICWLKDKIAKGVFRIEFGPQYRSNIVLTNSLIENAMTSTALYDRLKDRTIQKYQVVGTSWDFYVLEKYGTSLPAPWGDEQLTDEWDIVPKFYNTELVQNTGAKTTAVGSTVAKGDCAFEHTLGMALHDSNGRHFDMGDWTYLSDKEFKSGSQNLNYTFKDLKDDDSETYKLYPMVVVGGFLPILASPSADLEKEDFPVRIVSFEQTGSYYSKQQGYEYEGKHYFYKFNATTTVELNPETQHVKDWGYIYHDIYGEDKRISCAGLGGNTYADERWAYYYNESKRSVELFPYVKYYNDNSYYYGRHDEWWVDHEFPFPVSIVNFKQVSQAYDMGRYFSYEGKRYYYKFGAVTTVELSKDVANVEDWGYIYHDIYGVDKMISCANLGSNPYDDARYAYYYNDSERTVDLRPYVKYYGDDEYHVGPSETLALEWKSCPDNNHPHAIDLGWPSGTKWSCCNLGAITPEGRGDPYAWGETVTKDVFKFENYSLIEQVENTPWWRCIDIGRDIAGTEYDAARAQWGGSWQMPSKSDWDELDGKNVQTWVVHNGVPGRKYIGYNGNTIFIPATDRGEFYPGQPPVSFGYYWSSTCRDNKVELSGTSCSHYFYEGGMGNYGTSDNARERGLWIRPVIK